MPLLIIDFKTCSSITLLSILARTVTCFSGIWVSIRSAICCCLYNSRGSKSGRLHLQTVLPNPLRSLCIKCAINVCNEWPQPNCITFPHVCRFPVFLLIYGMSCLRFVLEGILGICFGKALYHTRNLSLFVPPLLTAQTSWGTSCSVHLEKP